LIIRPGGGSRGIEDYLVSGVKSGRTHTRDQLDKRVPLSGDLSVIRHVLGSFDVEHKTEKYMTFVLSFKEAHVDLSVLSEIDRAFKDYLMTAYGDDEFAYYSEVHYPKIKSYQDRQGQLVERKPHIHVVIPKINLKTRKKENPLGWIKSNTQYLDAFQEVINHRYGLASPKDNLRAVIPGSDELLDSHTFERGAGRNQIKQGVMDLIEHDVSITTQEQLVNTLNRYGEARVVLSPKFGHYINFKPRGHPKGINLKGEAFQDHFLSDRAWVSRADLVKAERDMDHGRTFRAYEVRHVQQSSHATQERFKSLSFEEQQTFLKAAHESAVQSTPVEPGAIFDKIDADRHVSSIPLDSISHINTLSSIQSLQHLNEVNHESTRKKSRQRNREESLPGLRERDHYDASRRRGRAGQNLLQGIARDDVGRERQDRTRTLHRLHGSQNQRGRQLTAKEPKHYRPAGDIPNFRGLMHVDGIAAIGQLAHVTTMPTLDRAFHSVPPYDFGPVGRRVGHNDFQRAKGTAAHLNALLNLADVGHVQGLNHLSGLPGFDDPLQSMAFPYVGRQGHSPLYRRPVAHLPDQGIVHLNDRPAIQAIKHINQLGSVSAIPTIDAIFRLRSLTQPNLLQHRTPPHWTAYINQFDCAALLDTLTVTHGIDLNHYRVVNNRRGHRRILVHASQKKWSASDFLINELHLSWPEAKAILLSDRFASRSLNYADPGLWSDFRLAEYHHPPFQTIVNAARQEKKSIYADYTFTYNPNKPYFDNQLTKRLLQNRRSIALTDLDQKTQRLKDQQEADMNQRYLLFLLDQVKSGDVRALAELRRTTPYLSDVQAPYPTLLLLHSKEDDHYIDAQYDYDINHAGDIHYLRDGKKVITDTQSGLFVFDRSEPVLAMAINLAKGRFGRHLEVTGATKADERMIHKLLNQRGDPTITVDVTEHVIEPG